MKRIFLTLAVLALVSTAASAQSRRLNRTKTKDDSAAVDRPQDGTIRDVRDDKNNGGSNTPTRVPTTVDPNNPNNNSNGTTPTPPPGTTTTPPAGTTRPGNPGSMNR